MGMGVSWEGSGRDRAEAAECVWQESERLRGKQRQAWGALNQVSEGPSARATRLPIGG